MAENKRTKTIKKFFDYLGIDSKFSVSEDDETISVSMETEDTGIIIGYHGETLEALQIVISLILAKEEGEFKRVSLEVGDYKKKREEWLERIALDAKDKALSEQREVYLSDLKAWERRVVHMILQEDKEVISESTGEGKDRVLVVKPK